jgi:hypothetical protein
MIIGDFELGCERGRLLGIWLNLFLEGLLRLNPHFSACERWRGFWRHLAARNLSCLEYWIFTDLAGQSTGE